MLIDYRTYLCTLFDYKYLPKFLCLYRSLERYCEVFCLYAWPMDKKSYEFLRKQSLPGIVLIPPDKPFTPELREAQGNRDRKEFFWTCGSYLTRWVMRTYAPPSLAYIDADCYFFGHLADVYLAMMGAEIAIVPHRYTPEQAERFAGNGQFNVSFVYFRNTEKGMACLEEWAAQCLEWCYYKSENGKFADQGYLDAWPEKYGAHVIQNPGFGLAPWNQMQYKYAAKRYMVGPLVIENYYPPIVHPLTMYHFHEFRRAGDGFSRTGHTLHPMVATHIYEPYEEEMREMILLVENSG